jgi:hypothetical protein
MNDIKNQKDTHLKDTQFKVSSTSGLAKIVSLNIRYEVSKTEPIQVMDENTKIIRRHSFDDNGGGYQGL